MQTPASPTPDYKPGHKPGHNADRTPRPSGVTPDIAIYERRESVVRSYARAIPRQFVRAEGAYMFDDHGGAYLDFLAGCSSLNYGHNHPVLKQALLRYIEEDGIAHGLDFHTRAKEAFLRALEDKILRPRGLDHRVMFTGPTGTNAVEAAIKLARKVTGRDLVVAFTDGFHGMTLGALSLTGNAEKRGGAGIPLGQAAHEPYDGYFGDGIDTAKLLERKLDDPSSGLDRPAAFIVETVQGEGGLSAASPSWLRAIARLAKKHGALLIVDDIQAGCGRTGRFFSFEGMGITPDIITMAKSLSGLGLPFAVTLIRPQHDCWQPGEHNGTFRGNNHAFVTAAAAIDHFWSDDRFQQRIDKLGAILGDELGRLAGEYGFAMKGRGMMQGLDVGSGALAAAITAHCFERGLVIETSGAHDEVVKVLAPLVIAEQDLRAGLAILGDSIARARTDGDGYSMAAE